MSVSPKVAKNHLTTGIYTSPELGVRVDYNVFGSAYYQPRIRGFRTAR